MTAVAERSDLFAGKLKNSRAELYRCAHLGGRKSKSVGIWGDGEETRAKQMM